MKPTSCLIIDDERLARGHLRRLAKTRSDIEVIGEAASPSEALRAIKEKHPQLLLLDIRMPGGGGFAILNGLDNPPAVIFVTAHEEHAIRAFEVNAVDYLLKPVTPTRFAQAIDRAMQRIHGTMAEGISAPEALRSNDLVLCEIGHSGHFVAVDTILAVEANGNYTRVTTSDGRHRLARQPLKEWGQRLPPEIFMQLDRGLILNRRVMRSVNFTGRSACIRLGEQGIEFNIGPAGAAILRKLFPKGHLEK